MPYMYTHSVEVLPIHRLSFAASIAAANSIIALNHKRKKSTHDMSVQSTGHQSAIHSYLTMCAAKLRGMLVTSLPFCYKCCAVRINKDLCAHLTATDVNLRAEAASKKS